MKHYFILLFLLMFICVGCEKNSNSGNANQSSNYLNTLKLLYENAKSQETDEAWTALIEKALEEKNEKYFQIASEKLWNSAKSNPEALPGLMLLGIKTSEDYSIFLRNSYVQAKQMDEEKRKAQEILLKQTINMGESIEVEGIRFKPSSMSIRTFTYKSISGLSVEEKQTDSLLCLNVEITNVTEGQVFEPINSNLLQASEYVDNFGNEHKSWAYLHANDWMTTNIEGIGLNQSIKTGEKLSACIPFESPKVHNSTSLEFTIYLAKSNNLKDNFVSEISPDLTKAIKVKANTSTIEHP